MSKWFQFDERTAKISGKLSFIFLVSIQTLLLIMIFYQRYFQDRPPAYYNDLAILLGISTIGFWLVNIFLGGMLPVITFKKSLTLYLLMAASIALPYTLIRGLPGKELWPTFILVTLGGTGLLAGGYSLAATLGQKRLERLSSSGGDD